MLLIRKYRTEEERREARARQRRESHLRRRSLRAQQWDRTFIACKNHPNRRCNRSRYVRAAGKKCASCNVRKANGLYRAGYLIAVANSHWARSMKLRERSTQQGWWADPLKLIQRYCGVDYGA